MKRKPFLWKALQLFFIGCILFLSGTELRAQSSIDIQGTVLDASSNEPLIGVSVLEKGTSNGTITDFDGKYLLKVSSGSTIVFSYIGYITQEVKAENVRGNIQMREDAQALDEVVVVGYGAQKKVNLTGAVSAVKIDESIASRSVTNVSSGLAGLVPGLVVSQSSGLAGSNGANLQIRGLGSINNSSPLIVVDGMPDVDINRINMNDIESISVLKDAASSAVYGSRAANGVILITTKNGVGQTKAKINYTGSFAASDPVEFYDYLADYSRAMTMHMRSAATGNKSSNFREGSAEQWMAMSMVDPILFPNTDQYKAMFRTGHVMNHTVSATGGSDKSNFYISVGIMDEKGLQVHNDFKRYNMRFNMDHKIRDNFKVGIKTDGSWSEGDIPRSNGLENAGLKYVVSGILNKHPETGQYGGGMAYGENTGAGNTMAEYEAYKTQRSRKEYNANAYAEWEIIKGLKVNVSYGLNYYNQYEKVIQNPLEQWNFQTNTIARTMPDNGGDGISVGNTEGHKTLFQGRINYDVELFNGHNLSAMFVVAEEYWYDRGFGAWRKDRLHPSLEELDAASAAQQTNWGNSSSEGLRSFIGRLNYNMYDKYLLELNFRYDGSSRFYKGHQWGFFPSAAVGWRVSEEAFFAPLKSVVSNFKIRGSIGELGNNYMSNNKTENRYTQKNTLRTTNYIVDGKVVQGFSVQKMINQALSWESTRVINIGFDLGFFDNKLTAEIDWYDRLTTDMLRQLSISNILTGYDKPYVNIADMRNRGIELNLTWRSNIGKFDYSVNVNGSYNINKLEKWGDPLSKGWEAVDMPYHFLYIFEAYPGLAQSWSDIYNAPYQGSNYYAPGDILRKDINGDGQINDEDKKAWKNRYRDTPLGQFGITLSGAYMGFDVQALFQGSYGRWDVWLDDFNNVTIPDNRYGYQTMHWNDSWSLDNRHAQLPRLVNGSGGSNRSESTYWAQQTSYLRMRNLQVGYSIPKKLLDKISFSRTRVFLSAENLFTITGWKGIDPEKNHDKDAYPLVKTYSVGLNIEF